MPVWRALGGITEIEAEGVQYVREKDQTAVWIDARDPEEFTAYPIPNARNLPRSGVKPGKDVGGDEKGEGRWALANGRPQHAHYGVRARWSTGQSRGGSARPGSLP